MSENTLHVIIFGKPGCGKGTHTNKLSSVLTPSYTIVMSDLLKKDGRSMSYMASGGLVPDEIVNGVLSDAVARLNGTQFAFYDGFPRTVAQAKLFDLLVTPNRTKIIELQIPDEEARSRMLGRDNRMRVDSDPSIIEKRLKVYHESTEPVLDYFGSRVVRINGQREIDVVSRDLLATIGYQGREVSQTH